MVHDGVQGVAELAGQTTYRYYPQLSHVDDFVSAIYGGDQAPMELNLRNPCSILLLPQGQLLEASFIGAELSRSSL